MEMPYIIHGRLSDVSLLPGEVDLPQPEEQQIEPALSPDIEPTKPKGQRAKADRFLHRTPREHLEEAKKALADGYKPHKNPLKTCWGRVFDAERHLNTIGRQTKEYREARRLMKEVQSRLEGIENVSLLITRRLMIKQREMIAEEFEFLYLAKNLDVHIALSGTDKSHLRIECPSLCEVYIHKMVQETDLLLYFERAGFKKVTLGDGEHLSWAHSF